MQSNLTGRSIFVVEDDPLMALDIEAALESVGAHVAIAATMASALEYISNVDFDAAVVDHALGDHHSFALYQRLGERGIPFLIYSGGATTSGPNVGHLDKPATSEELIQCVTELLRAA